MRGAARSQGVNGCEHLFPSALCVRRPDSRHAREHVSCEFECDRPVTRTIYAPPGDDWTRLSSQRPVCACRNAPHGAAAMKCTRQWLRHAGMPASNDAGTPCEGPWGERRSCRFRIRLRFTCCSLRRRAAHPSYSRLLIGQRWTVVDGELSVAKRLHLRPAELKAERRLRKLSGRRPQMKQPGDLSMPGCLPLCGRGCKVPFRLPLLSYEVYVHQSVAARTRHTAINSLSRKQHALPPPICMRQFEGATCTQ